ncbi:hypothetical protein [Stieleria magnilauensis]|uniref:hypothetical protein n=1 Tax=Stieleria magnilauensis TaxID=2527963 RepID=UPI003AF6415D
MLNRDVIRFLTLALLGGFNGIPLLRAHFDDSESFQAIAQNVRLPVKPMPRRFAGCLAIVIPIDQFLDPLRRVFNRSGFHFR